ncbi:TcdA/TcdB catalytic glycosyltransferase domain-containing protein [Kitasatospora sp. NPDC089797]|uniref:scabin-related ADP-ribosyltransferase n=1 Tax=Kitasatospora sp. NPDC089797 TaxID=3155298 RepID=UPI00341E570B
MSHSSIHVSPGLAQFFHIISGMPWPESDEGLLRDVRDDYLALADDLPQLNSYIQDAVRNCDQRLDGLTAQAFRKEWGKFVGTDSEPGPLDQSHELCTQLAELANKVALSVEYTKWMAIAQLVQLLVEIAFAIAWSVFTGGASLIELEWQKILTRQFLIQLLKKLGQLIAMHTIGGVIGGLVLDAVLQAIQFGRGDRHEWDTDLTKQAAIFGAISGAIGGPLSILGEGLGKLLGAGLSKLFVKTTLDDLIKGLAGGVGKDLAGDVGKDLAGGVGKDLAGGLSKELSKDLAAGLGKGLGEGAAGGAAKGAGKEAGEGFGRLLGDEAAERFAGGIAKLLKDNAQYLAKGFKAGRKVGAATGREFVHDFGKLFEQELGKELGADLAREMGEHLARQFAEHSLKTVAKESSREALVETLENLAKDGGAVALTPELKLLVEKVPELAGGINKMNKMFHLGTVLGGQFESGINQYLTEGIYNTIYNGEWQASGMSFLGGFMMAGMRHMIMGLASPLTIRYTDWVRSQEWSRIPEDGDKYYGPLHPITILAVISHMGGQSAAPFPVPRPGHIDQIGGTRLSGGDGAPLRGDGASLSGSSLLGSVTGTTGRPRGEGEGVLADPEGRTSHGSSIDGERDPKADPKKVPTESRSRKPDPEEPGPQKSGKDTGSTGTTGKRGTTVPGPPSRVPTEAGSGAGNAPKTPGRGGTEEATASADSQGGTPKPSRSSARPDPERRSTVRAEQDEPPLHSAEHTTQGGPAGPADGPGTGRTPAHPNPGDGSAPLTPTGSGHADRNQPDPQRPSDHPDPNRPGPNQPDPQGPPKRPGPNQPVADHPDRPDPRNPDPRNPEPPAAPPRDPKPEGPGPDPQAPFTAVPGPRRRATTPEPAAPPAADARSAAWHEKQQALADRHDAVFTEAETRQSLHEAVEDHLIEAHADLPRDLRTLTAPGTEAWRRTTADLRRDIEARPHEREDLLAGAADRLRLAGARELALRIAVDRFDHLLTERGLGRDTAAGDHLRAEIRREAAERFRTDAARDLDQVYATPEDLTPERNTLALQGLERRLRHAAGDLDVRQARAAQTGRIEEALDRAHRDWRREDLSEADRALLDAAGVPHDARVSSEARDQLAEEMRRRLDDVHGRYQERTALHADEDEAGGGHREEDGARFLEITDEHGEDLAALDSAALGRERLDADFQEAFEDHRAGLAHEFTVQAVREAVLKRATGAVDDAAAGWKDGAAEQFGADVLRELGLAEGPSPRAVAEARAHLARLADRLIAEHTAAGSDPARLKERLDALISPAGANRLLALHGGREEAVRAAAESARTAVPHDLGGPDDPDHGGDAAASIETALGRPVRGSRTDGSEPPASSAARRVREGYTERIRTAFDEAFRPLLRDPAADHRADLPGRLEQWRRERERLTEGLAEHVAFESAVLPARERAAADHDRRAQGSGLRTEEAQELKVRYGGEFFDAYKDHWGPEDLDRVHWLGHEAAHENVFGPRPEPDPKPEPRPQEHPEPTPDTPSGPLTTPAPDTVLPASAWADIRALALPARMDTVRFDPRVRGQYGSGAVAGPGVREQFENRRPDLGGLQGTDTTISYDVRRFEARPGHWVTEFTLNLHLQGPDGRPLPGHEATALLDRARAVVAERFNERFHLPGGDQDQVHLRVDGTQDPALAHHTVTVSPGLERNDQSTWSPESPPGVLLHELLHFLGLPDEYVEPAKEPGDAFALRRRDRWAGENGAMGTAALRDDFTLLPRHLQRIEDVLRSGPVLHDLTFERYRSDPPAPPARPAPGPGTVAPGPLHPPAAAPAHHSEDSDSDGGGGYLDTSEDESDGGGGYLDTSDDESDGGGGYLDTSDDESDGGGDVGQLADHFDDLTVQQNVEQPAEQPVPQGYYISGQAIAELQHRNVTVDENSVMLFPYLPPHDEAEAFAGPWESEENPDLTWAITLYDRDAIDAGGERLLWRHDFGPLYRWENGSRDPEEVFLNGFRPQNPDHAPNLHAYVTDNEPSVYVSTTRLASAQHDEWGTAYRYLIDAPGGIDVDRSLPHGGLAGYEGEVAFPGGIRREYIVGVEYVSGVRLGADGRYVTQVEFVPNPFYWPAHRNPAQILHDLFHAPTVFEATHGSGLPFVPGHDQPVQRTLLGHDGGLLGSSFHTEANRRLREEALAGLAALATAEHQVANRGHDRQAAVRADGGFDWEAYHEGRNRPGHTDGEDAEVPLPWDPASKPYFTSLHANGETLQVAVPDHDGRESYRDISYQDFADILRGLPGLSARPGNAPLVLLACKAGLSIEGLKRIADATGRTVHAVTGLMYVARDGEGGTRLVLVHEPDRPRVEFVTVRPTPGNTPAPHQEAPPQAAPAHLPGTPMPLVRHPLDPPDRPAGDPAGPRPAAHQDMVPSARDLEMVEHLRRPVVERADRPQEWTEQQHALYDQLAGPGGAGRSFDFWRKLGEDQAAALVMIERKGREFAGRERALLKANLRAAEGEWAWAAGYPRDSEEALDRLVDRVQDHLHQGMFVATNLFLDRPPGGIHRAPSLGTPGPQSAPGAQPPRRTLLDLLIDDPSQLFKNFWQTGDSQGDVDRSARGANEEHMGYAATLNRAPDTWQDFQQTHSEQNAFAPGKDGAASLPKYGALVSELQPRGVSVRYGGAVLRWKNEVRDRVTHTPKDSFAAGAAGSRSVTSDSHPLPLLNYGTPSMVRRVFGEATGFEHDVDEGRRLLREGGETLGYFESQIHGDLHWRDLHSVTIVHLPEGRAADRSAGPVPTLETARALRDRLLAHRRTSGDYTFTVHLRPHDQAPVLDRLTLHPSVTGHPAHDADEGTGPSIFDIGDTEGHGNDAGQGGGQVTAAHQQHDEITPADDQPHTAATIPADRQHDASAPPPGATMSLVGHPLDAPLALPGRRTEDPFPAEEEWSAIAALREEAAALPSGDPGRVQLGKDIRRAEDNLRRSFNSHLGHVDSDLAHALRQREDALARIRTEQPGPLADWAVEHRQRRLDVLEFETRELQAELHRSAQAAEARQEMVPSARDLELVAHLRSDRNPDAHAPWTHQEQDLLNRLTRPGLDWKTLDPVQAAALVMVERKAMLFEERDRDLLTEKFTAATGDWDWAQHYPRGPEQVRQLIDDVERHMNTTMFIATNFHFDKPLNANRQTAFGASGGFLGKLASKPKTLLDRVVADKQGQFRNVWETGASQAAVQPSRRGGVEEHFGYAPALGRTHESRALFQDTVTDDSGFAPKKKDRGLMPKYGALVSELQPFGVAPRYGAFALHWSDDVRARATHTPRDSWSLREKGASAVTSDTHLLPLLLWGDPHMVRRVFGEATGFRHDADFGEGMLARGMITDGYFETQIHGPLTWSDLQHIVISHESPQAQAQAQAPAAGSRSAKKDDTLPTRERAEEIRTRLEEFRDKKGYTFTVQLRGADDPPVLNRLSDLLAPVATTPATVPAPQPHPQPHDDGAGVGTGTDTTPHPDATTQEPPAPDIVEGGHDRFLADGGDVVHRVLRDDDRAICSSFHTAADHALRQEALLKLAALATAEHQVVNPHYEPHKAVRPDGGYDWEAYHRGENRPGHTDGEDAEVPLPWDPASKPHFVNLHATDEGFQVAVHTPEGERHRLLTHAEFGELLKRMAELPEDAPIVLLACKAGQSLEGLKQIADATGRTVHAVTGRAHIAEDGAGGTKLVLLHEPGAPRVEFVTAHPTPKQPTAAPTAGPPAPTTGHHAAPTIVEGTKHSKPATAPEPLPGQPMRLVDHPLDRPLRAPGPTAEDPYPSAKKTWSELAGLRERAAALPRGGPQRADLERQITKGEERIKREFGYFLGGQDAKLAAGRDTRNKEIRRLGTALGKLPRTPAAQWRVEQHQAHLERLRSEVSDLTTEIDRRAAADESKQLMVASARDLQLVAHLQGTDAPPLTEEERQLLDVLRGVEPGQQTAREGAGPRLDWNSLDPGQAAVLVMVERKAMLFAERDRTLLAEKFAAATGDWDWAQHYPRDAGQIQDLLTVVERHMRRNMGVATNFHLDKPLNANRQTLADPSAGGDREPVRTLLDVLLADAARRFRNAWETGASQAAVVPSRRGGVEELFGYAFALGRLFGTREYYQNTETDRSAFDPTDGNRALLPKYGALVSNLQPYGVARRYGAFALHWSDAVRARVTHTPRDSWTAGPAGALSVTSDRHPLPLLLWGDQDLVRLAFGEATDFRYDPEFGAQMRSEGMTTQSYFETQIHGPLTWSDLDHVVISHEPDSVTTPQGDDPLPTRQQAEEFRDRLQAFGQEHGLTFRVELRQADTPLAPAGAADHPVPVRTPSPPPHEDDGAGVGTGTSTGLHVPSIIDSGDPDAGWHQHLDEEQHVVQQVLLDDWLVADLWEHNIVVDYFHGAAGQSFIPPREQPRQLAAPGGDASFEGFDRDRIFADVESAVAAEAAGYDSDSDSDAGNGQAPISWRGDHSLLYRWENDHRHPDEVFANGFAPRDAGSYPPLETYLDSNPASAYVSTTRSATHQSVGWGTAYRYLIDAPGGIDIRATFPNRQLADAEQEVAFPGGIHPRYIVGVEYVNDVALLHGGQHPDDWRYEQQIAFVPNPGYYPDHRAVEQPGHDFDDWQDGNPGGAGGGLMVTNDADSDADGGVGIYDSGHTRFLPDGGELIRHAILGEDDTTVVGHSFHTTADFALRKETHDRFSANAPTAEHQVANPGHDRAAAVRADGGFNWEAYHQGGNRPGHTDGEDAEVQVPWNPAVTPYFANLHGTEAGLHLAVRARDGREGHRPVTHEEFGRLLARTDTVAALPENAPIVLLACKAGLSLEGLKQIADATGRTVHAVTGRAYVAQDGAGGTRLVLLHEPGAPRAEFVTAHPTPREIATTTTGGTVEQPPPGGPTRLVDHPLDFPLRIPGEKVKDPFKAAGKAWGRLAELRKKAADPTADDAQRAQTNRQIGREEGQIRTRFTTFLDREGSDLATALRRRNEKIARLQAKTPAPEGSWKAEQQQSRLAALQSEARDLEASIHLGALHDEFKQRMIPGPRDLELVAHLMDLDTAPAARAPWSEQEEELLDRLTGTGLDWKTLDPVQVTALLLIERKSMLFEDRDRALLVEKLTTAGKDWEWAAAYQRAPERMQELITDVERHMRTKLSVVTNFQLDRAPNATRRTVLGTSDGTPEAPESKTLLDMLRADPLELIRNAWETGSSQAAVLPSRRGGVEENLGYAWALRRLFRTRRLFQDTATGDSEFDPRDEHLGLMPKYGALVSEFQPFGVARRYGAFALHWSDDIRARVTHTPRDSWTQGEQGARAVTSDRHLVPLLLWGDVHQVRLAFAEATGFRHDPDWAEEMRSRGMDTESYFETQIHGPLALSDLRHVVISHAPAPPEPGPATPPPGGLKPKDPLPTPERAREIRDILEALAAERGYGFTVELREAAPAVEQQRLAGLFTPADPAPDPGHQPDPPSIIDSAPGGRPAGPGGSAHGLTDDGGDLAQQIMQQLNVTVPAPPTHVGEEVVGAVRERYDRARLDGDTEAAEVIGGRMADAPGGQALLDAWQHTGPGAPALREVPRTIHFIWIGAHINDAARNNIQDWITRTQGTDWEVAVWTDQLNAWGADEFPGATQHDIAGVLHPDLRRYYNIAVDRSGAGAAAGLRPAYAAASDLARYSILSSHGGVYADVDLGPGEHLDLGQAALALPAGGLPVLGPLIRNQTHFNGLLQSDGAPAGAGLPWAVDHLLGEGQYGNHFIAVHQDSTFMTRVLDQVVARLRRLDTPGLTGALNELQAVNELLAGFQNQENVPEEAMAMFLAQKLELTEQIAELEEDDDSFTLDYLAGDLSASGITGPGVFAQVVEERVRELLGQWNLTAAERRLLQRRGGHWHHHVAWLTEESQAGQPD